MNVIRATISDISNILKIFEEAKAYIKSQGFDQWQNEDYPNEEIIQDDISNEASFILCDDDKL
ncbi:MAG: GNAT family N-acetyltransferase, partial [Peptostreptococcaceae bacterium]|nr:GNAT family N-acetyltransferase [Peptostreptococcaceae bacterium]